MWLLLSLLLSCRNGGIWGLCNLPKVTQLAVRQQGFERRLWLHRLFPLWSRRHQILEYKKLQTREKKTAKIRTEGQENVKQTGRSLVSALEPCLWDCRAHRIWWWHSGVWSQGPRVPLTHFGEQGSMRSMTGKALTFSSVPNAQQIHTQGIGWRPSQVMALGNLVSCSHTHVIWSTEGDGNYGWRSRGILFHNQGIWRKRVCQNKTVTTRLLG